MRTITWNQATELNQEKIYNQLVNLNPRTACLYHLARLDEPVNSLYMISTTSSIVGRLLGSRRVHFNQSFLSGIPFGIRHPNLFFEVDCPCHIWVQSARKCQFERNLHFTKSPKHSKP